VTSDVWAFLRHHSRKALKKDRERAAIAYLDQAFEFFTAAANPRVSSRPLLYYYSFLNLTKVFLLHQGLAIIPAARHGLSDPRANIKKRLAFEGQSVKTEARAQDHSAIFPELVNALGGNVGNFPREFRIVELLKQMPGIHRTFCKIADTGECFCPLDKTEIYSDGTHVWVRLVLRRGKRDVERTIKQLKRRRSFMREFTQVDSGSFLGKEMWFDSLPVPGQRRGIDRAIMTLRERIGSIGVWAILTDAGYRHYFGTFKPAERLPQLCSVYAAMFYLGSVTRYKPYDFDRIIEKHSWLISEFLETQPSQFLHIVASMTAGVDVVRSYASMKIV
jgi:hypothetical protein